MTDDELTRAYDALRRQRQARPTVAPPSVEALQALVENQSPALDREALLERVLESGASDELALLQSVSSASEHAASEHATTKQPAATPSWRRWWPAAAAAVLVVAVGLPMTRRSGDAPTAPPIQEPRFRGAESAATPMLLAPTSDAVLLTEQRFVWSSVADATQYEVEVTDADGQPVAAFTTPDTTAVLPAGTSDASRASARAWTVIARLRDGRQQRSALRLLRAP